MIKIQVIPALTPSRLKAQADDLWRLCSHKDRTPLSQWTQDDKFCSHSDRQNYILAIEDDEVVGTVTILKRQISFQGHPVLLGGIAKVCTHPKNRKHGIAIRLLERSMKELKHLQCDLAYLCTDIEGEGQWLYSKVNFVPLGRHYTYLGHSGKQYEEDDGMIAPVSSAKIFRAILEDPEPFDIGVGNW